MLVNACRQGNSVESDRTHGVFANEGLVVASLADFNGEESFGGVGLMMPFPLSVPGTAKISGRYGSNRQI